MKKILFILLIISLLSLIGCSTQEEREWKLITDSGSGTKVSIALVDVPESLLPWFESTLTETLKSKHSITLTTKVTTLSDYLVDMSRGATYDMVYFYENGYKDTLKAGHLYENFAEKIINFPLVNPLHLYRDGLYFGNNYVPISSEQIFVVYDVDVFYDKPLSYDDFFTGIRNVKGAILPHISTKEGMAFVQGYLAETIDFSRYQDAKSRDLTEFASLVRQKFEVLKELKPYLATQNYIKDSSEMEKMYIEGASTLFLTFDSIGVSEKIKLYEYPEDSTVMTLPTTGTITSIACVHKISNNKSGAMMVINEMLDPQMQVEKLKRGHNLIYNTSVPENVLTILKTVKQRSTMVKYPEFLHAQVSGLDDELKSLLTKLWEEVVEN